MSPADATVEDKSFTFVEAANTEQKEADVVVPPPASSSLLDGVKNLFRS